MRQEVEEGFREGGALGAGTLKSLLNTATICALPVNQIVKRDTHMLGLAGMNEEELGAHTILFAPNLMLALLIILPMVLHRD